MRGVMDEIFDGDIDVELFAQFPAEGAVVFLVRVDFASWKFPHSGEVNAGKPPRDQEPAVLFDDRGDNREDRSRHEGPAGRSSAILTRSASCPGVNGFCNSGMVPQKVPCTEAASSVNPDI